MPAIVADVGGTNSRLALVSSGGVGPVRRYANDGFADFGAVLARFLSETSPDPLSACVVAVAGPVTGGQGRLTNRDWGFDAAALSAALPGEPPARLVNDLAALGHALPALAPDQVESLRLGPGEGLGNGQRLVVGLGTGFNVCLVTGSGEVVEAELGHASLPASLAASLGPRAGDFATCEALFSGPGLARLHDDGRTDGARLVAAAEHDPAAAATLSEMARLLGLMTREMTFHYMPLGGIAFAGSVARSLLGPLGRTAFLTAATPTGTFSELAARVPLRLITDDAAALTGLARLSCAPAFSG